MRHASSLSSLITNPDHEHPLNYLFNNTDSQKGQNAHLSGAKRPRENHIASVTNTSSFGCTPVTSGSQYSLGLEGLENTARI